MAGASPVFAFTLWHGADPHQVAWELGYRVQHPLSITGEGDDVTLTVQVRRHRNPVRISRRPKTRRLDANLVVSPSIQPIIRQRLATYAIVLSASGILATQYSDLTAVSGMWGLPGGGIDVGENPSQAIQREVMEETGQHIAIRRLLDVQTDHWIGRSPTGVLEDFHAVRIIYAAECQTPTVPVVQDVGGTTASSQWVAYREWRRLNWSASSRSLLIRHLETLRSAT